MSETLKPCPFCGGEAEFEREGNRRQSCIVACTNCGCRHEGPDEGEESGHQWNMREDSAARAREQAARLEEAEHLHANMNCRYCENGTFCWVKQRINELRLAALRAGEPNAREGAK